MLLYRADAEFLLKDYNAAIHTYDLLLEMKPDTPEYMYRQSSCYARIGDTDNALKRYQEAKSAGKEGQAGARQAGGPCWPQEALVWTRRNTIRPWRFMKTH